MNAPMHVIGASGRANDLVSQSLSQAPRAIVAHLDAANRLALWAMRLLAEDRENWNIVQQELWLCCGLAKVERVLQPLERLLEIVAHESRRPMLFKPSDAPRISCSEGCLLALLDAARENAPDRLAVHARWLVRPLAQGNLIEQARNLARGLA